MKLKEKIRCNWDELQEIRQGLRHERGIYTLSVKGKYMYVGKSQRLDNRMRDYLNFRSFVKGEGSYINGDVVEMLHYLNDRDALDELMITIHVIDAIDDKDLLELEDRYIKKHKPHLNKQGSPRKEKAALAELIREYLVKVGGEHQHDSLVERLWWAFEREIAKEHIDNVLLDKQNNLAKSGVNKTTRKGIRYYFLK